MAITSSSDRNKYMVYGRGRWREFDVEKGTVSGWGPVRFVVMRRGKLHVMRRRLVLAALRAHLAKRHSAIKLGPRLQMKRISKSNKRKRSRKHSLSTQTSPITHCRCCECVENNRCTMMRSAPGLSMPLLNSEPGPQTNRNPSYTSVYVKETTDACVQTSLSPAALPGVTSPSSTPTLAKAEDLKAKLQVSIERCRFIDRILKQREEDTQPLSHVRRIAPRPTHTTTHQSPRNRSRSRTTISERSPICYSTRDRSRTGPSSTSAPTRRSTRDRSRTAPSSTSAPIRRSTRNRSRTAPYSTSALTRSSTRSRSRSRSRTVSSSTSASTGSSTRDRSHSRTTSSHTSAPTHSWRRNTSTPIRRSQRHVNTPRRSSRTRPLPAPITVATDSDTDKENFDISPSKRLPIGPIVSNSNKNTKKLSDATSRKTTAGPKSEVQKIQKKAERDGFKKESNIKNNSDGSNNGSNNKRSTSIKDKKMHNQKIESEQDRIGKDDDRHNVGNNNIVTNQVAANKKSAELDDELQRQLREKVKDLDERNARPSSSKEYSSMEDHVIVAWISSGTRAQLVNGNRVWRELEPLYPRLAGRTRSWHSLRNRYLRHLLPALAKLALPLKQQQQLRAAAARGEIKKVNDPDRRNSIFGNVRRGASSRAPPASSMTRKQTPPAAHSSPPPSPARTRRSLRYSEVTRQFAERHRTPVSSSPAPSPPPTSPSPGPTGKTRGVRRLYNPNTA